VLRGGRGVARAQFVIEFRIKIAHNSGINFEKIKKYIIFWLKK